MPGYEDGMEVPGGREAEKKAESKNGWRELEAKYPINKYKDQEQIVVTSQEELNAIVGYSARKYNKLEGKEVLIDFGSRERPAVVNDKVGAHTYVVKGNHNLTAKGTASVMAYDQSYVRAEGTSHVEARGMTIVSARGNCNVQLYDSSIAKINDAAHVVSHDKTATVKSYSNNAVIEYAFIIAEPVNGIEADPQTEQAVSAEEAIYEAGDKGVDNTTIERDFQPQEKQQQEAQKSIEQQNSRNSNKQKAKPLTTDEKQRLYDKANEINGLAADISLRKSLLNSRTARMNSLNEYVKDYKSRGLFYKLNPFNLIKRAIAGMELFIRRDTILEGNHQVGLLNKKLDQSLSEFYVDLQKVPGGIDSITKDCLGRGGPSEDYNEPIVSILKLNEKIDAMNKDIDDLQPDMTDKDPDKNNQHEKSYDPEKNSEQAEHQEPRGIDMEDIFNEASNSHSTGGFVVGEPEILSQDEGLGSENLFERVAKDMETDESLSTGNANPDFDDQDPLEAFSQKDENPLIILYDDEDKTDAFGNDEAFSSRDYDDQEL